MTMQSGGQRGNWLLAAFPVKLGPSGTAEGPGNVKAVSTRTVLITGAASGIGAATARRFVDGGWFVGLADIDAEGAAALARDLGTERALALTLDVRDDAAWARAAEAFGNATGGRLDALINNAGLLAAGPLADLPADRLRAMVDVNLTGAALGVQACLPLLKATPGARIVNVASISGLRAMPEAAVYSATKYALRGLSQALRDELRPSGVAVSTVYPAFAATPMLAAGGNGVDAKLLARLDVAGFRHYTAESIAKAIWKAVTRGRNEAGAGGQARAMRLLAATCPPLLALLWRLGRLRAGRAAKAAREPAPADRPTPRPRTTGSS
ncbi:MAG TPA: SDR family NAD(P)-dependent oxidoreductase [Alphaproteobacteria bacterium]|nr:SDR family NAD(P)-dependent oxidoreductase [Alphaproteobacteria bacterium]